MKLQKLAVLALVPVLLSGCTAKKEARNLLYAGSQSKIVQLARDLGDKEVKFSYMETGHYAGLESSDIVYYINFKENAPVSAFSLSGGLVGMRIVKIEYSDEHLLYITIAGKVNDMSATSGDIVMTPEAYDAVDPEYAGFTFYTSVLLGDETTSVDR